MLFLANMGGPSLIPDIKTAFKRAKFFTKNLPPIGGAFSLIGKSGLSIPIRNGLWYIDLKDYMIGTPDYAEQFGADLLCHHWMARRINEYIDNHLIENDEEAKWAMAAWLYYFSEWGDWSLLDEKEIYNESGK